MMIKDKKGKKYFQRDFIKKLKYYYNNDEVQSVIKNVNPKELVDCYGKTLLHYAVTAGNQDLVEYLIGRGFEVDAQDEDMSTPLALAMRQDDERMMAVLLAAGADVFVCNKWGRTLLHVGLAGHTMMRPGRAAMLFEQLKKKYSDDVETIANILLNIEDPFPRAMLLKNTAVTKYMLRKGCSVHDTGFHRETALHYAVECMDLGNVKLLLELGADVHAKNWNLDTPIHYYHFGKEENHEILHCLLSHGASLDETNDDGFSVINQAFQNEKAEHIKVLLDHGVDVCELDAECTPLHYLARNENPGVMELLQDKNYEVDIRDNEGRTPLFTAAESANPDAVDFLLKNGADPNIADEDGETALLYSLSSRDVMGCSKDADANYVKCVELLLQYGADVQFVSSKQKTLFDDSEDIKYVRPAIAQVAMMKALDQRVHDVILNKIQSRKVFVNYFDICLCKMEKIKNTVIYGEVMLSTFLVEPEEKLLIYARNEECRASLEKFLRRERHSPLYFIKILCSRIESIVAFAKLREQATSSICKISGCHYRPVIDKIVMYLDEQSMKNVCQV